MIIDLRQRMRLGCSVRLGRCRSKLHSSRRCSQDTAEHNSYPSSSSPPDNSPNTPLCTAPRCTLGTGCNHHQRGCNHSRIDCNSLCPDRPSSSQCTVRRSWLLGWGSSLIHNCLHTCCPFGTEGEDRWKDWFSRRSLRTRSAHECWGI